MVHNRLYFHKVSVNLVPKRLNEVHKHNSVRICQHLLDNHAKKGEMFLKQIITGNVMWINHFEPESKH